MLTRHRVPRLVFTPGEPAGIGPDLCLQLAQEDFPFEWVVIAAPDLLKQRADLLCLSVDIQLFDPEQRSQHRAGQLSVLPVDLPNPAVCGRLNPANSGYVLSTIAKATKGCMGGVFDALVTGPVHKGVINDAGMPFTGHTEFIADMTGGLPVMMLATPGLRVALATTHLPLVKVSAAITKDRINRVLKILDSDLRSRFHIAEPNILVCGLNPHAGEGGHLGREELDVIEPVLDELRRTGLKLQGPLPADTLFTPKYLSSADAVLAMYHDQGLPVLKHMGFGRAVNITLGLPIVRTSVDHGTALDLAGTGQADAGSLRYALEIATTMVGHG